MKIQSAIIAAAFIAGCATTTPTTETPAVAEAPKAEVAQADTAKAAYTEFSKIDWIAASPKGEQGPMMFPIHGDPKTGPVSFIFKMPAGHSAGLHMHPARYAGAVVKGTLVHGKSETENVALPAGSTWTQEPNQPHYTACAKDADCVIVGHFDGPLKTIATDKAHEGDLASVKTTPENLVFKPLNPKMPNGPQMMVLHGDHTKEAFRALVKVPAGFKAPLHTHDAAYAAASLSGSFQKNGSPALTAGSIWSQAGKAAHHNACVSDTPCIFFIAMDGAFSMTPAKAAE